VWKSDQDGLEVIRRVRESSHMPILVVSARDREKDKVAALDLGADDYIAKPFGVLELLARIRAALRRSVPRSQDHEVIRFGRVEIDLDARIVKVDGRTIHLTRNEYKLLYVLSKHAGKVLTQQQLLNEIWGPNHLAQAQYLRVYIAHLRRKLEADPARPQHLQTESGVGYRLVID
jgi:two-component system, OmpR family, KDP operon response regulator KdpE